MFEGNCGRVGKGTRGLPAVANRGEKKKGGREEREISLSEARRQHPARARTKKKKGKRGGFLYRTKSFTIFLSKRKGERKTTGDNKKKKNRVLFRASEEGGEKKPTPQNGSLPAPISPSLRGKRKGDSSITKSRRDPPAPRGKKPLSQRSAQGKKNQVAKNRAGAVEPNNQRKKKKKEKVRENPPKKGGY